MREEYDIVAIGGGPAGLTVGLYGGRMGLKTLVIDKQLVGGAMAISPLIENYPGVKSASGTEMTELFKEQATTFGADILELTEVVNIDPEKKIIMLNNDTEVKAKTIVLTTGSRHRLLDIPGEEKYTGRGVSYCATCDGVLYRGKRVVVVGGSNTAAIESLHLAKIVGELSIIHRRDQMRAEQAYVNQIKKEDINFYWNSIVTEILGDDNHVTGIKINDVQTEVEKTIDIDGVFIAIGYKPNSELAAAAGIELTRDGYVRVDRKMQTSVEGIYAAGDITGGQKQLTTSTGQATEATMNAFLHIKGGSWY
jgi:thioredoxin reductase (NADPH)